ncbi:hypothetical protein BDV95DRAFT_106266 [Massariosphaeria phaeospora]|uniref:ARID domain-containing protein n=1 Tax=Massariosphaeria phaeospora TaxID=100035 RepID=A0A7C8MGK5_9PLEO|nr:hypothetical protein BDV95DRAFT_106266 [Massariosphaeria phaeospora]
MDFQSPQNGLYDPSSFIDPGTMANGQMNGTRSYPMTSIPQKRDSTGATLSRSQTPSQPGQFGYQQGFSHTPSPTMQPQHFRPGQVAPQRMQTMSPAQNPHAPQMSPMGFAQPSPMPPGFNASAGGQYPVQSVQLSHNLQARQHEAQRRYAMQIQHEQQQSLGNLAASNMVAQQRQQHAAQAPGAGAQHPGMQGSMMQAQQVQQQQQQQHAQAQAQAHQAQAQAFVKNVGALMAQNRRPFNPQPHVAGRPIDLSRLYTLVMRHKGCRYVTQTQSWPRIAQMIGIAIQQFPTAGEELRMVYEQNLGLYESAFVQRQQTMKGAAIGGSQATPMGHQMSPTRQMVPGAQQNPSTQQEYLQQLQRQAALHQQRQEPVTQQQPQFDPSMQHQQQLEHSTPMQSHAVLANVNGRSTPQADGKLPGNSHTPHQKSMSQQLEGTPPQVHEPSHSNISPAPGKSNEIAAPDKKVATPESKRPKHIFAGQDGISLYKPSTRTIDHWGGMDLSSPSFISMVEDILTYRPNMPSIHDMGVIDIRALTMSIRSGLHSESRLALDALSKLTYEQNITVELEKCEDLVEVLVEYAEDQLDILANENPEVSDILDLTPYEDVLHNYHGELRSLQNIPEFGTKAYELDRTADRLLAITTILRNLSFLEINHASLASSTVLKFLSNAIRLVGTRILLLRSHINTFDFMKDLITFFSNVGTRIVLPSREDAYAILHFLCAFAPCPRPSAPVRFTPYNPKIHRYLPSAVDSLAKLLARDDPNRTYYKQIFINEATSSPPYDLLTRAFALAISVVPDRTTGRLHQMAETQGTNIRHIEARIAEGRKPYLMQGMLAADILASLAPGPESGVCHSWLESDDGWAVSLLKFAMSLCTTDSGIQQPAPQQGRGQRLMDPDIVGFQLIVYRALSMLKRLGDKSRGGDPLVKSVQTNGHGGTENHEDDEDDDYDMETYELGGSTWKVRADILPKKETLLGAILTSSLDVRSLKQFLGIGYLAET